MTFKNKKPKGNLLLSVLLSFLAVTSAYFGLNYSLTQYQTNLKLSQEDNVMLVAHSIAALLKEDIQTNYSNYSNTSNTAWTACRTTASVTEFINRLNSPAGNCANVSFLFNNFEVIPATGQNAATSLTLAQLSPVLTSPQKTLRPKSGLDFFEFDAVVTITSFNTAADRNLLNGTIQLVSKNLNFKVNKTITMAIDIGKTVLAPLGKATAKLCRSVAGSVCELGGGQLDMTFLNSSGQILRLATDQTVSDTGLTTALTTVSVKNIDNSAKTEYSTNSFCLPTSPGVPVPWILDAATDNDGNTYYLTVHGMLLDSTGTNRWAVNDPKFISIAYDNVYWLLLRSDGTVFRTLNIVTLDSMEQVSILPTAIAITTGKGPNPC
ncbi:MAG: hypothetical protein EBR01_11725 [Proteobacteria bacterium]|nr:hypothetical protein [Pseudomonadota bacterium]